MKNITSIITALVLSILQILDLNVTVTVEENYIKYEDISYGDADSQKMDIYVPDSARERKSNGAFLLIHGGSWSTGDKTDMEKATYLAMVKKGYIVVSMNYTLFSSVDDFGTVTADYLTEEVQMAVNRLKDFSDRHRLNISGLCPLGVSAGAHISMLYTYKYTQTHTSPIPVVFTANLVGPCDFSYDIWSEAYSDTVIATLISTLAGKVVTSKQITSGAANSTIASISPVSYITSSSVPSIACYGEKDTTVPSGNATSMKKALQAAGIPYTYISYPNSDHSLKDDPDCTKQFKSALQSYAKKYFGY